MTDELQPVDNYSFTIKEAAWTLGVATTTIYGWIYQKKIECFKVGGSVRILKSELKKIITKNGN